MLKFWAFEMKFTKKMGENSAEKAENLKFSRQILCLLNFSVAFFAAAFFKAAQKPIFKAARNPTTKLNLPLNSTKNSKFFPRQNSC